MSMITMSGKAIRLFFPIQRPTWLISRNKLTDTTGIKPMICPVVPFDPFNLSYMLSWWSRMFWLDFYLFFKGLWIQTNRITSIKSGLFSSILNTLQKWQEIITSNFSNNQRIFILLLLIAAVCLHKPITLKQANFQKRRKRPAKKSFSSIQNLSNPFLIVWAPLNWKSPRFNLELKLPNWNKK